MERCGEGVALGSTEMRTSERTSMTVAATPSPAETTCKVHAVFYEHVNEFLPTPISLSF